MGSQARNVIQHDFGFPRIVRREDAEREGLYALLVSLGATKMMAERVMQAYPHHASACQAILDFASDGEADMRGAIAELEEDDALWWGWRGGAI
jgi:hypothetical protein